MYGEEFKSVGKTEIQRWVEELQAKQDFGQPTQNRDLVRVLLDVSMWRSLHFLNLHMQ